VTPVTVVLHRAVRVFCRCRRIIKAAGEWGMPRFRLCVVNSDRDRDGFVLLSEIQEAVTTAKLIIPISSLEAFFRTLRPTRGMVRVVDVLEPFQVRACCGTARRGHHVFIVSFPPSPLSSGAAVAVPSTPRRHCVQPRGREQLGPRPAA
jgi:hypothetical protein